MATPFPGTYRPSSNQRSVHSEDACTVRALKLAAKDGAVKLIQDLSDSIDEQLAQLLLLISAMNGRLEVARLMVERWKADVNETPYKCKKSPLHLATISAGHEMALFFVNEAKRRALEGGYSLMDKLDGYGGTVLQAAAFYGNVEFATVMFEELAPEEIAIDHQDNKGNTAFILAAQQNQSKMLELLLQKGANVDTKKNYGYNALHTAAFIGNADAVQFLVEKCPQLLDVKLDSRNASGLYDGCTAIQLAALNLNSNVVKALRGKADETGLEETEKKRHFQAYKEFHKNMTKFCADFRVFNPRHGVIGGPEGAIPWRRSVGEGDQQAPSSPLHGIMKMSIVALGAIFEEFCLSLQREAFQRAIDQNLLKPEWITAMKAHSVALKEASFQTGVASSTRSNFGGRTSSGQRWNKGPAQLLQQETDFLENRFEEVADCIKLRPTLQGFDLNVATIFQWNRDARTSYFRECLQRLPLGRATISVILPPDNQDALIVDHYESAPLYIYIGRGSLGGYWGVLDRLSRLFYGLRCVFAHGLPDQAISNTLSNESCKFEEGDFRTFDGQPGSKVAKYLNEIRLAIINAGASNRFDPTITYREFVACLRIYKLLARVIQAGMMVALGLWQLNDVKFDAGGDIYVADETDPNDAFT